MGIRGPQPGTKQRGGWKPLPREEKLAKKEIKELGFAKTALGKTAPTLWH